MARPLVVRVGDLLREPGSRRAITRTVDLGSLATSAAATVPDAPLEVVGRAVGIIGGVEASGAVHFDWVGPCRRCLDEVVGSSTVEFREICQRHPIDDEVLPIDDDLLDLEPLVRELVLSGLPLAPLCSLGCAGPDPDRFPTVSEAASPGEGDELPARDPVPDPRWSPLAELRFDEPPSD